MRPVVAGDRVIDPDSVSAVPSEDATPLLQRCRRGGHRQTRRHHPSAAIQKLEVRKREQAIHAASQKGWI